MSRVLKHAFYASVAMVIGGCSGGGCGGCAGMTPLPGGFEPTKRIENAGSARLTDSGMQFLSANIGTLAGGLIGGGMGSGGVVEFPVPESGGQFLGFVNYTICPGGPDPNANPPTCLAEIDLGNANLQLTPAQPHNINVSGTIPLRLQDLPFDSTLGGMTITLNGNDSCPGDNQAFADIGVDVSISVEADLDPAHARFGYSRIKIASVNINQGDVQDAIKLNCSGFLGLIADLLKGVLVGQLMGGLSDTLVTSIEDQLCQKSDPSLNPPCPTGTNDVDGVCRYGSDASSECVSVMLGMDGNINLGQFLSSISPATKGSLDILFAAGGSSARGNGLVWGDANPANGGVTLGLLGGAEPKPVSKCVQPSNLPLPTGVPIPQVLFENTVPNWPAATPGPHMGIALNERFLNYALSGIYNSGALCLGIAMDNPLLSTGTFGLLAPSMQDVGIQRSSQPLAIVVRPGAPPSATIGNGTDINTDPVIRISLPNASFDFYVWSLDRFIRFMTATYDLDVPLNLTVTPEGLTPVLQNINMTNGKIENAPLLAEDPGVLAEAIASLVGGQIGAALGGGLAPIDINSSLAGLGLKLVIPETVDGQGSPGLRKLTEGTDNYLGIFAALEVAAPMASVAETSAMIIDKQVDRRGLFLQTMTKDNGPSVRLALGSSLDAPHGDAVLFSYRVDNGFWSPPSPARDVTIQDALLRAQGRHKIQVRARLASDPYTLDPTPAVVEVVIDREAPFAKLEESDDGRLFIAVDDGELGKQAELRFKLDDGNWSEWMQVDERVEIDPKDAFAVTIETKDQEGNVAQTQEALRGKLPAAAGGCGCEIPGKKTDKDGSLAALLAALGVGVALRRRKKAAPVAAAEPVSEPPAQPSRRARRRSAERSALGALAVLAIGTSFAGCNCGDDPSTTNPTGEYKCDPPNCNPLEYGLIGEYSSVAVHGSDIWVAGYAEADWNHNFSWGDLVVGKWDGAQVTWEAVDGVPADPAPDTTIFDKNGFRGGQTNSGDDVGTWASIAVDDAGHPAVSYYDRTHHALKFARSDGTQWTVQTVQQKVNADIGRYSKLAFVNGQFVIAFQVTEPGAGGAVRSVVRVAEGDGAGAWTFADAVADEATPCKKYFCAQGTHCFRDTGKCEAPASGCADCASGTECADHGAGPTCTDIFDSTYLETYPDATGLYISLAVGPGGSLGLAYYDRIHGNLGVATKSGANWTSVIVDGADPMGVDNGDKGIGASLAIDSAGDFHLSYIDGIDEALKYVKVVGGTAPGVPELVDDGYGIEQVAFTDGQHLVGDDSRIFVTQGGEIRIAYQDATSGKLRFASGTPNASGHSWLVQEIAQDGWAGAFSSVFEVDGAIMVANWWRQGGADIKGDVRILQP